MNLIAALLSPAFLLTSGVMAADPALRPNILLIFTDDQGIHDVGCYGSEFSTPNIDRIAQGGMKFTNWYSASSICTPSRFGLLTGRNPSRSRDQLLGALMFMAEEDKARGLQPGETTIAATLKTAGYDTALIGKWHLGHGSPGLLPTRHGFDRFIGHTGGCIDFFTMTYGNIPDWFHQEDHVSEVGYATELITDEALSYLDNRAKSENPFFLYLAYNAPHFGKGWSPKDEAPVNIMQPQSADLKRVTGIDEKVRHEFAAMTTSLDDGVGRLLDHLQASGLEEDTLVIFLTDHGGDPMYGGSNKPYRGDKATLFEGGLRVPCLMQWPGQIPAGSENADVVWSIDLFPTFCHLASAATESLLLDGSNLVPAILAGEPVPERTFFWELGAHAELERKNWSAVRQGDWKFLSTPKDGEFLFNLALDPREGTNFASMEPVKFTELRSLRDRLAKEMRSFPQNSP